MRRVYLELYRTTLGRMVFDNLEVTASDVVHADKMFSSAYRDARPKGRFGSLVPYVASPAIYPRERSPPRSPSSARTALH